MRTSFIPSLAMLHFFVELAKRSPKKRERSRFRSLAELARDIPMSDRLASRRIGELKKLYDRPLFNINSLTLTRAGKEFQKYAEAVLKAHAAGRHWPLQERREMVIGTTNRTLHFVLPG